MKHQTTHFNRISSNFDASQCLVGVHHADVVVVGGGLSGLSCAVSIAERQLDVHLLEMDAIGSGASGRCGGHVLPGFSANLKWLVGKIGQGSARAIYNLSVDAVKVVKSRTKWCHSIEELEFTAGLQACSPYTEFVDLYRRLEWFQKHFAGRREIWNQDRTRATWNSPLYKASIHDPDSFTLNPLAYVRTLASKIQAIGVPVHEKSPVLSIERLPGKLKVRTSLGHVECNHVIVCCAFHNLAPIKRLVNAQFPLHSYMLTTPPLGKTLDTIIKSKIGVMDWRHSFAYYRPLADGRLIWGGRSGGAWSRSEIENKLLRDIQLTFPQLHKVNAEIVWSGIMSCTPSGMPQIGQLDDRIWFNQGHGSHGFASSTLGGELISAAIAEADDSWRRFAPFNSLSQSGQWLRMPALVYSGWQALRDRVSLK